jgi:hypothetical protein
MMPSPFGLIVPGLKDVMMGLDTLKATRCEAVVSRVIS